MHLLESYSHIWQEDKDKNVCLMMNPGIEYFLLKKMKLCFFLIEDDAQYELVISKMMEHGNKVYNSIEEIQQVIGSSIKYQG